MRDFEATETSEATRGGGRPASSLAVVLLLGASLLAPPRSLAAEGEGEAQRHGLVSATQRLLDAVPGEWLESLWQRGWVEVDLGHPDGRDFDGMEALVVFDLPKDRVLDLLAQTERQPEYRNDLRDLRPIEHSKDYAVDEHRSRIMLIPFRYRLRYHFDRARSLISWRLDPGHEGSLETLDGFWALHELGEGRTLAHFGALIRVSDAIPGFLQDSATRHRLPRDLQSTREWVNDQGS